MNEIRENSLIYLPLSFGSTEVFSLVDTGATRSFISSDVLTDLLDFLCCTPDSPALTVVLPNGNSVTATKSYIMKFEIANVEFNHKVYVLDINS